MMHIASFLARSSRFLSRTIFHRGGETWPGELVIRFLPHSLRTINDVFTSVIFVVGTNGKTTTTAALVRALEQQGKEVITNPTGANQLNGVISSILTQVDVTKKKQYVGVFELDEYSLAHVVRYLTPTTIVLLNVVRDQLDRYGEVHSVLDSWSAVIATLPATNIVANAADPGIAYAIDKSQQKNVSWFSIPEKLLIHEEFVAGDSIYCYNCGNKLHYKGRYVSHIGIWSCSHCGIHMPENAYTFPKECERKSIPSYVYINLQAVYKALNKEGYPVTPKQILENWVPAFGRNEVVQKDNKTYAIILGKNPASWSVAYADFTRSRLKAADAVVFLLNNRIPDGRDVSWIWDIAFTATTLPDVWVGGDRAYDMAERLEVEKINSVVIEPSVTVLYEKIQKKPYKNIVVIANYTAMLAMRKVITGKELP